MKFSTIVEYFDGIDDAIVEIVGRFFFVNRAEETVIGVKSFHRIAKYHDEFCRGVEIA